MVKIGRMENKMENSIFHYLVERGTGREKWWGPQVFSPPPSKYNLFKLERKLEWKMEKIFRQKCPHIFFFSFVTLAFCFLFFLFLVLSGGGFFFFSFFIFLIFYFYYFFKKKLLDDFLCYFLKCPLSTIHNFF